MASRVLAWVLAIVFIMAGLTKLIGQQQAVEGFHHFGYSDEFRLVIGALEVIGGIGILSPRWGVWACGLLAGIMVGAAVTLLRVGEDVLPPLIVGALLVVLFVVRRRAAAAPA